MSGYVPEAMLCAPPLAATTAAAARSSIAVVRAAFGAALEQGDREALRTLRIAVSAGADPDEAIVALDHLSMRLERLFGTENLSDATIAALDTIDIRLEALEQRSGLAA